MPDFHYNELLGQVFEARVGRGSLLVCGYDLTTSLDQRPAARHIRRSLFHYLGSDAFRPTTEVPLEWIERLCGLAGLRRLGAKVVRVDSEDTANGNVAANILDGDPSTFWHTRWQPRNDPMPHEIVIDLGRETALRGITYLPRQDQSNGRIALADVFASPRNGDWGEPVGEIRGPGDNQLTTVLFKRSVSARFLRIVVKSEVNNQPFAAIAELDILTAN